MSPPDVCPSVDQRRCLHEIELESLGLHTVFSIIAVREPAGNGDGDGL